MKSNSADFAQFRQHFASDNQASVHPEILNSLILCNGGHQPSYGGDPWTVDAEKQFSELFEAQAHTLFVFNGTAANVVGLRALVRPYEAILCSDLAHLNADECGAPEFFTGAKLRGLPSVDGKISVKILEQAWIRQGDVHFSQAAVVSLTQPTEYGTVYSLDELKAISEWVRFRKLKLHIDGTRIANAVVHLKTTFHDLIVKNHVDAISFGGTKNGMAFGEAVVVFDAQLAHALRSIRKQSGQLPSKGRYVAAQFSAYLKNQLWRTIAEHSMQQAQLLQEQVADIQQVQVTMPVQSNGVFARIPQEWLKPLREKFFFYLWDEELFECRWMCAWDTRPEDVMAFANEMRTLSMKGP